MGDISPVWYPPLFDVTTLTWVSFSHLDSQWFSILAGHVWRRVLPLDPGFTPRLLAGSVGVASIEITSSIYFEDRVAGDVIPDSLISWGKLAPTTAGSFTLRLLLAANGSD